jgi:hypothetical protein
LDNDQALRLSLAHRQECLENSQMDRVNARASQDRHLSHATGVGPTPATMVGDRLARQSPSIPLARMLYLRGFVQPPLVKFL